MDYAALSAEITSGPRAADCAPHVHTNSAAKISGTEAAAKDSAIAAILNEPVGDRYVDMQVNARMLMSKLGAVQAAAILDKLEAAGASVPAVKWAMRFIDSPDGINLGDPQTLGMLDVLLQNAVLTAQEVEALKALVRGPSSRAIVAVGQPVSAADVSVAIRGNSTFQGIA